MDIKRLSVYYYYYYYYYYLIIIFIIKEYYSSAVQSKNHPWYLTTKKIKNNSVVQIYRELSKQIKREVFSHCLEMGSNNDTITSGSKSFQMQARPKSTKC